MYYLQNMSHGELVNIIRNKIDSDIEIPAAVTKFKTHIPEVDFSHAREVKPPLHIFTPEGMVNVLQYAGNNVEGKFIILITFVYANDGKIFYKELPTGNYNAHVVWEKAGLTV